MQPALLSLTYKFIGYLFNLSFSILKAALRDVLLLKGKERKKTSKQTQTLLSLLGIQLRYKITKNTTLSGLIQNIKSKQYFKFNTFSVSISVEHCVVQAVYASLPRLIHQLFCDQRTCNVHSYSYISYSQPS